MNPVIPPDSPATGDRTWVEAMAAMDAAKAATS